LSARKTANSLAVRLVSFNFLRLFGMLFANVDDGQVRATPHCEEPQEAM
jgi:hypothetical protein